MTEIITEKEENALRKIKSIKELVFLFYKYQLNYMIPREFSSWEDLTTFVKKSVYTSADKDFQNKCKAFIRKFERSHYKEMHYKISLMRTNFNADKDIDVSNYEEAIFWYKILIKFQVNFELWNSIALVKNYDQIGFICLYREMKSVKEKAQLLEAIDFFMDEYKKIIAQQQGEQMSDQCYDNMKNVTQRDVLNVLLYFELIPGHMANEPKMLSISEVLNSTKAAKLADDYRSYLDTVFNSFKALIKYVNHIFLEKSSLDKSLLIPIPDSIQDTSLENSSQSNDQETPSFNDSDEQKDSSATENNYDSYGAQTIIMQYIIAELKEIDWHFYKELTLGNYESFINDDPPNVSEAVCQERWVKIGKDIKTIVKRSPKLLKYLKDNSSFAWEFGVIPF